jgi:hypothetical protein
MYIGATRKRKGTKQTGDDDGDTHDEGSPSVATLGRQPDPPKAGEPRRLAHRDWQLGALHACHGPTDKQNDVKRSSMRQSH